MIFDITFHRNDQGLNITAARPREFSGATMFHFSGRHPFAMKNPNTGQTVQDFVPIDFDIPAESVEDAFAKLPDLYKAEADKLLAKIKLDIDAAKQMQLRDILLGGRGDGSA